MAIELVNKSNVDPADADFPFGDVRDKTPSVAGTRWDRETMSDYIQIWHKIMAEAGVTYNGVLDNEYSGWQFWEALGTVMGGFTSIIEIGAWDMDTDATKAVVHNLADHTKITSIFVTIIPDVGTATIYNLEADGTISQWDSSEILLARNGGGGFDVPGFSNGVNNRGFLTIKYLP